MPHRQPPLLRAEHHQLRPRHHRTRRLPVLLLTLTLAGALGPALPALHPAATADVSPDIQAVLERARAARTAGEYETALQLYDDAEARARDAGDRATAQRLDFYRALTYQRHAESTEDARLTRSLADRALHLYRAYLHSDPTSAATYNNMARLHESLGEHDVALKLAERARQLADEEQDPRAATFARTQADLLAKTSPRRALDAYQATALAAPKDVAAHEAALEPLLQGPPADLLEYLWRLYQHRQVRRAEEAALRALEQSTLEPRRDRAQREYKEELLALIAASLGERDFDPATFVDSPTYLGLKRLAGDPDIGEGILELFQLLARQDWRAEYSWWSERGEVERDAPRGLWPRAALQRLMGGMARWYQSHDRDTVAERCYLLASEIDPRGVDPSAFLQLSTLYAERGEREKLADLTRRYEHQLYAQKTRAYREGELDEIFAYHQTLGLVYARLDQWGDGQTVTSAIFQLEAARRTAEKLRQRQPASSDPKSSYLPTRLSREYRFTPELTNLLAEGYVQAHQPLEAAAVRLESARLYSADGDPAAAERVLAPYLEHGLPQDLQPEVLRQYTPLLQEMQRLHPRLLTSEPLQRRDAP